jgi:hypothetical protein
VVLRARSSFAGRDARQDKREGDDGVLNRMLVLLRRVRPLLIFED